MSKSFSYFVQVPQGQGLTSSQVPSVVDSTENVNMNSMMQQIIEQIHSCKPEQQAR